MKVDHTTDVYVPYSFKTVALVFTSHKNQISLCCETEPTVPRPYPRIDPS